MPPATFLQQNRRSLGLMAGLLGFQLLSGSVATYLIAQDPARLPLGGAGMLIFYLATTLLLGLGLASSTVVASLGGLWFGWASVGFTIASYLLASLGGYTLGQRTDRGAFAESLGADSRFGRLLHKLQGQPFVLVFLCRLLPVGLPFALVNVALALVQVRLGPYLLGGLLGMLPRTLLFVWASIEAKALFSGGAPTVHTWVLVGLGVGSLAGLGWLARRVTA
jgi:uncharacterized membrane protein YdjX (TVP38/TMEM64 family)